MLNGRDVTNYWTLAFVGKDRLMCIDLSDDHFVPFLTGASFWSREFSHPFIVSVVTLFGSLAETARRRPVVDRRHSVPKLRRRSELVLVSGTWQLGRCLANCSFWRRESACVVRESGRDGDSKSGEEVAAEPQFSAAFTLPMAGLDILFCVD